MSSKLRMAESRKRFWMIACYLATALSISSAFCVAAENRARPGRASSHGGLMRYQRKHIEKLRACVSRQSAARLRPQFLFLCGGAEGDERYVARGQVEQYLKTNKCGRRIVCIKPEKVLSKYSAVFRDVDLLMQEKLIAEISEAILLFDESPGSLCELGAFAACDPIREILTVFVPKEYKGGESFAIQGPVAHIERYANELSSVIYGDTSCPLMSEDLLCYLNGLSDTIRRSSKRVINYDATKVEIGAFCFELLDLISVFSPLTVEELNEVYCLFKDFPENYKFYSERLGKDVSSVTVEMLVCFLAAGELVKYENGLITMMGELPGYFMFNKRRSREIAEVRVSLLALRRRGRRDCSNVHFGANVS